MRDAAKLFVLLTVFIVVASGLRAQDANTLAEEEAVKRQEATIRLHQKVLEAADAEKKHRIVDASKLYQEAFALVPFAVVNDPRADADKAAASNGLVRTRVELSERARKNGDLLEAQKELDAAVRVQPQNEELHRMKMELDVAVAESRGTRPSLDVLKKIPEEQERKVDVATKVQNGKLLYEMGRLNEAQAELKEAIKIQPDNKAAYYYLDLIKEANYKNKASAREEYEKDRLLSVENAWLPSHKNETLAVPNPYARTNLVFTTKGRQNIFAKLEQIHLNEVSYDLPLSEVLKTLRDESKKRDPEQKGINFLINPHTDAGVGAAPAPDQNAPPGTTPTAAVPVAPTTVDLSQVTIKISPPLNDVTLADVLDAITKVADVPIKYTIEDYAVVFSPRPPEAVALYSKQFHVDPNTFIQGLESVRLLDLSQFGQNRAGGQGGGGGGGGQQGGPTVEIPSVSLGPLTGSSRGGQSSQPGQGVGLNFVTRTNNTQTLHEMVRAYFTAAGVTLTDPGKSVFFNDRTGLLLVRASLQDLEIIEAAVEMLNQSPPQLTIESKFAEMTQDDSKALGFDWFLGNVTTAGGAIGMQGGTAPSYQGNGTTANPSGIFPGGGIPDPANPGLFIPGAGAIGTSASDSLLTSGLRQTYGNNNTIPAVGTITGILTDPQFRVVIRAIEQRAGADLLSAPKVTTLSGRQAHVSVLDLVQIVTGVDLSQTAGGQGGANTIGQSSVGVVASQIQYSTDQLPFGPTLDVLPTVSADGYSIQMVLIPAFTEFLGYDNPGQFVPQAQSVGGSTLGLPITAVLPLPRLRVRQVVTTCNVWDGQTVVLGGLISEDIRKIKDKVPVLGDLPFVGRLFRSESNESSKKNLLVFVTPTLIDPAGNRLHTEEEMPFARTSIPAQPAPSNQ